MKMTERSLISAFTVPLIHYLDTCGSIVGQAKDISASQAQAEEKTLENNLKAVIIPSPRSEGAGFDILVPMPQETILVCYSIAEKGESCWLDESDGSPSSTGSGARPNAFELRLASAGQEIFLYDILRYFYSKDSSASACNYRFIAYLNESRTRAVALSSPSSLVPVIQTTNLPYPLIILHMFPSAYPPLVPLSQITTFSSISRFQLYSHGNASLAESQLNYQAAEPRRQSQGLDSNVQRNISKSHAEIPHHTTSRPSKQSTHTSSNDNKSILVNEDVVAIAEAAKEAAGAAARSFLSFAASTMKNVADLSMGGLTSGATTIGKTKVFIIRELADGGFGKVFLVQDASDTSKHYAMKQMHCQSGNCPFLCWRTYIQSLFC